MTKSDYIRILKETKDNIIVQAVKSIKTEGITLVFTDAALDEIANVAEEINRQDEDTGARRLISILDTVLEELSFEAPEIYEQNLKPGKSVL